MRTISVPIAYVPLVDAAPLIVAKEMGFARAEGLSLDLIAAPSWSSVRDMLAFGRVDAAHLLSPVPVAMALGLGGVTTSLAAVSVLSVNGNSIGVGRRLETALRDSGYIFDFEDAAGAATALAHVAGGALTIGVPFPFSMHVELIRAWVSATELSGVSIDIRTVPPPLMAEALAAGEVDAFCVGEPWGSVAVDSGAGALLLPGRSIWAFAPEKVLAVRSQWAETEPHLLGRVMRAVWQASRWLSNPDSRTAASELLARPGYLDVPAEVIDRSLSGHMAITSQGEQRDVPNFLEFYRGAATFPWRSQAKWIASQMAKRSGTDTHAAMQAAGQVFRSDLYRQHLGHAGADLPGASEKIEGNLPHPTAVASVGGRVILERDVFFDGRVFDPMGQ
ncbi:MAG: ABC transporter substrate-binding protein [Pseudomonadota bacterium]